MLGRRQNRPSLIGTAARTAVVVGTANKMNNRNDAKQAARAPGPAPVMEAAAVPAAAGGLTDEAMARLKQLADLHQAGILSEAEFADQKAKILNG